MDDLYSLSSYDYELPEALIAQHPLKRRDASRLMVVDRQKETIEEIPFYALKELLSPGDALVFNDTKVIPARLVGLRESGGKTEIFLLKELQKGEWKALAKPARKLQPGAKIQFSETFSAIVTQKGQEGEVIVSFSNPEKFWDHLQSHGQMPLPHYIKREEVTVEDEERYQTVYAGTPGAVAAPTAGLHFTESLLQDLEKEGIEQKKVTLHVGLGTFKPVFSDDIRDHKMHREEYWIAEETAHWLNHRPKEKKTIAVGTTCCRTLESAADTYGVVHPGSGDTSIFIYPGYSFRYVSHLLTNFHLPRSTLLMLVSAFAGHELIMAAYQKAVKERFRFFSYGDAMLIL